jgi:hypothetical protein
MARGLQNGNRIYKKSEPGQPSLQLLIIKEVVV